MSVEHTTRTADGGTVTFDAYTRAPQVMMRTVQMPKEEPLDPPPSQVGKDNVRHVSDILPKVLEEFIVLMELTNDPEEVDVGESAASLKDRPEFVR